MATREIFSFVQKFQELRCAGYSAHLDIDAHAGKAWVGLRLQLDHVPWHPHQHAYHKKPFSASRNRRRERRAAAQAAKENAEEASETTNDVEVNTSVMVINKNVENENLANENKENDAEEVVVLTPDDDVITNNNEGTEKDEGTENNKVRTLEPLEENDRMIEKNVDEENDIVATHTATATHCPEVITVYGTAILENCPDAELNSDYGDSIRRFLSSEQHLVQNVSSVDLKHLSSRSFRNNTHTHTVAVTLHVKTGRLWESPASYVRKHLGLENYWERSNGTRVKLSRIHQK